MALSLVQNGFTLNAIVTGDGSGSTTPLLFDVQDNNITLNGQDTGAKADRLRNLTVTVDDSHVGPIEMRAGELRRFATADDLFVTSALRKITVLGGVGDDIVDVRDSGTPGQFKLGSHASLHAAGNAGNDSIIGSFGADEIHGGSGNDFLKGWQRNDVLFGDDGDDRISASAGQDTLYGGEGNDDMHGEIRADDVFGGPGDDIVGTAQLISGQVRDDETPLIDRGFGGPGNDLVVSFGKLAGRSYLEGGEGDDTLEARAGADTIYAGNGNDVIDAGLGPDLVVAGPGDDFVIGDFLPDEAEFFTHATDENDDILHGDEGDDTMLGGLGNDILNGRTGNNDLDGNAGLNTANYTANSLVVTDSQTIVDGLETNVLASIERVELVAASIETVVLFDASAFSENTFTIGGIRPDIIIGGAGHDILIGGGGADHLTGGAGDDLLVGSSGKDRLNGGSGNDILYGGKGADRMFGGTDADSLYGQRGNDKLYATSLLIDSAGSESPLVNMFVSIRPSIPFGA